MFWRSKFDGDISKWNVSRVGNMSYMFMNSPFSGDISGWDMSRVENMYGMLVGSGRPHLYTDNKLKES